MIREPSLWTRVSVGDGTLANPYGNLQTAMANAQPGDIVRVVGNGGLDGDITTVEDNLAFEIGFGNLVGSVLSDGAELVVPSRVTLMIDEGAIFKLKELAAASAVRPLREISVPAPFRYSVRRTWM